MNTVLDYTKKPIIAMLHLMGNSRDDIHERMVRETNIYFDNGVDAVMVENYFGGAGDCEEALRWLARSFPDRQYGVNILGDYKLAFRMAREYGAKFVQIDSVCGHLPPKQDKEYAEELAANSDGRTFDILGGLRFKYQPVLSGRSLEEDARLAAMRCEAVVTTGSGTGEDSPTEKLIEFKRVLGATPLIVGAGVTADTVAEKLQYADGVIIGSWLKDGHTAYAEVSERYVKEFMDRVRLIPRGV